MTMKTNLKDPAESARQKARRERRLSTGLCVACGRVPPEPDRKLCSPCKVSYKAARRQRYERLLAAGLCACCGQGPSEAGKIRCVECGQKNATKKKQDYINAKARGQRQGTCTQCGNRSRKDGFLRCERCITNSTVARLSKIKGFSREKLNSMGDCCRICSARRDLVIDHDHATNEFRGVLCRTCNAALGMFRDSPDLLLRAIQYLRATATAVVSQIDQPTGDGRATEAQPRYLN